MIENNHTFYVYYQNQEASLSGSPAAVGSALKNVYDPMLELRTDFTQATVDITGVFPQITAVDALCLGYTNASQYRFVLRNQLNGVIHNGVYQGIQNRITIEDMPRTLYAKSFTLRLEGTSPLYLGLLYLGPRVGLPRFGTGPELEMSFTGESGRFYGGQAYGMERITLESFSAEFPRLTGEEKQTMKSYAGEVLNIRPHIIDPYPEARGEFPPMYVTISSDTISFPKRVENGFYYSSALTWQEAK
jgi:hypothetical protein